MPLAGAYDESKKMIALTQLPDALLARLADWDSNLMLRLTIVKTTATRRRRKLRLQRSRR